MAKNNNHKAVSYNKWGYIFLIPFGEYPKVCVNLQTDVR